MAGSSTKFKISEEDWAQTPLKVREIVDLLLQENRVLKSEIDEFKAKLNQDSSNPNKPPSSDNSFARSKKESQEEPPEKKKGKRKRGDQKGHKQALLRPTHEEHIWTTACVCGHTELEDQGIYYYVYPLHARFRRLLS